jgi:hypothetical protein
MGGVPSVDLLDEIFVVADPAEVARRVADPALWRRWWPGVEHTVFHDRGREGLRWSIAGDLVGTCEVWLQAWGDGVIVHAYVRADPTRRGSATEPMPGKSARARRRVARIRRSVHASVRRGLLELKDDLDLGRPAGVPREGAPSPAALLARHEERTAGGSRRAEPG